MCSIHPEEAHVHAAVTTALPRLDVARLQHQSHGYANDHWVGASSAGQIMIKVAHSPEEDPEQLITQRRIQRSLAEIDFPTPELLWLDPECELLNHRQLSVLRYLPGEAGDTAVSRLGEAQRVCLFRAFGAAVGRLHTVELPPGTIWRDDGGRAHQSWTEVVGGACAEAIETILEGDGPHLLTHNELAETERRVTSAVARTESDVVPRIVHRDLHLGNVLVHDDHFAALLDFEMVREWDFVFDFIKLQVMFTEHPDSRGPFVEGYQETAGPLPASFETRRWAYAGLGLLLSVADYLDGNPVYATTPDRLRAWLDQPIAGTSR